MRLGVYTKKCANTVGQSMLTPLNPEPPNPKTLNLKAQMPKPLRHSLCSSAANWGEFVGFSALEGLGLRVHGLQPKSRVPLHHCTTHLLTNGGMPGG